MIKVYGSVFSRAGMVMLALEELGLEYESVDMLPRSEQTQSEEYRALNPTGKIPTLVDGDLVLFETQAILYYLARQYGEGRLWADTPAAEADILRWSLYISNQLEVPALDMLIQFKFKFNRDNPDQAVMERAGNELNRFLPLLERQLDGQEWLSDNRFTIADIHGALVLSWPKLTGFDYSAYPNVHRWVKSVLSHPAQKRLMDRAKGA
ncbi:glutathione S-transferase family protein [Marinobacterium sp. AK62]|uniref:Glutathione S-transferase family protein n=1 Tax=Marinobacterium alkalitolerans TaxID=1542925 RepID=A0ABS3ZAX1_9GAMM|nr:glutathione S-transferase family protein [Marinobacterium alkalitolerans]MBP0048766.1 glutathione S-transferase family protein [Marinobacterium alkalitolerans]